MKVLQINVSDIRGGAALVAWNLHQAFLAEGFIGSMAVKRKYSNDSRVQELNDKPSIWAAFWKRQATSRSFHSLPILATICNWLAEPGSQVRRVLGIEEFEFPATRDVDIASYDLIHCHVLHGGYFDLRVLKEWSRRRPVIITLHDAWLLAGHCAHSFACEKWMTGCGSCPDISIPVKLELDNSALNWRRKRQIFQKSQLYVAAPSQWLLEKAERSILARGARTFRHIPHGVDTNLFCPANKQLCRERLGLPQEALIFLFAANGIRKNRWKDFPTLVAAVRKLSAVVANQNILFVALGHDGQDADFGDAEIRFVTYVADRKAVATYYAAADVYVHAARAETFPNAILEALASGLPVVASAVGGIPEQIAGLAEAGYPELNMNAIEDANGILVPPEDSEAMANAMQWLSDRPTAVEQLGHHARAHALKRFDLKKQISDYKSWYDEVLQDFHSEMQTVN